MTIVSLGLNRLILIFDKAKGFLESFTSNWNHFHHNFPPQKWLLSRTTETTKTTERGDRKERQHQKRREES